MQTAKPLIKRAIDFAVLKPIRYITANLPPREVLVVPRRTVLDEINDRVASESADYAMRCMERALVLGTREALWDYALTNIAATGLIAEFGVWQARSTNHIARRVAPRTVYGFDSFEGLHVDWTGWVAPKGTFHLHGNLPAVEANVVLVKGWFDKTLPEFLARNDGGFALIHIDCDTYEATKIVLDNVKGRLAPGVIVMFDEYFGYRGWREGEYKAWQETVGSLGLRYEYLAFSVHQVVVKVVGFDARTGSVGRSS